MKRLIVAGFALALFVPAFALAQSAFNGTWKTDLSSMHESGKPLVIHLKNGVFENNDTPPTKVKADGEDHAVTGHPGFDTVAIKVVNDHTIQQTEKKDGKTVSILTVTVAPDGKTATYEFTNNRGSSSVTGKGVARRVAKGAPGSNAVAGSWRFAHMDNISSNGTTFSYKVDGNNVSYSDPNGIAYTATIDGKAAPFTSGSGITGTTVLVKKLGKDSLRETWEYDGKATRINTMTVAADGKTLKTSSHDLKSGNTITSVADKQ